MADGAEATRDNDLLRLCLALLLACLAPGLLLVGYFEGKSLFSGGSFGSYLFLMAPAFVIASLGVGFVGIWAHLLLMHRNWTGYRHYILAGILAGIAIALLVDPHKTPREIASGCIGICIFTVASAAGFRLGWGKP